MENIKELSSGQREELLCTLKVRFEKNMNQHLGIQWVMVNKKGMRFSNSGVTLLTIKGGKVVQGQDFMTITGVDEYKQAWGDIK